MAKVVELRSSKEVAGMFIAILPARECVGGSEYKEIDLEVQVYFNGKDATEKFRIKKVITIDEFSCMIDRYMDIMKDEIKEAMREK